MDFLGIVVGFSAGISLGGLFAWLFLHLRFSRTKLELETRLNALQKYGESRDEATSKLTETFTALASDALSKNNQDFLRLANETLEKHLTQARGDLSLRKQAIDDLVKPLAEELKKIEKERQTAYGGIEQLINSVSSDQRRLAGETQKLTQALRSPQVRGRWGEMTLRRVAELSGMVNHCDFVEQETFERDGRQSRPDLVVLLPNDRRIAVDSKTPLDAYLQALEAVSDEERTLAFKSHARQLRDRVRELSNKSYWTALGYTPEFVVLFLPGEPFLGAALQEEPRLLDDAMRDRVVIATPSTLIALLHAVAYGWRQEQLAENARQISTLGQEMYDRLSIWADHLVTLRRSLSSCVEAFNKSVGSLESRVMVSARRFTQLGLMDKGDIPQLGPIDSALRRLDGLESASDGADEDELR